MEFRGPSPGSQGSLFHVQALRQLLFDPDIDCTLFSISQLDLVIPQSHFFKVFLKLPTKQDPEDGECQAHSLVLAGT